MEAILYLPISKYVEKMKHTFTLILFLVVSNMCCAQYYVNDKPLDSIDSKYIVATIKGYNGFKSNLEIDYGQDEKSVSNKVYLVRDENDKWVEFRGIAQIYNYLYELGYIYVETLFSDALEMKVLFARQTE